MDTPIELIISMGLRVFARDTKNQTYCFFTDGVHIGYAQWSDYRTSASTVHKPSKAVGTGFKVADEITPESLIAALNTIAPHWASDSDRASVRKYRDINEYLQASKWNSELLEVTA